MSSVEPQTPYNEYPNVNGVTTVFPYEFQLLAASDLVVTVDGVEIPSSDFILSGVGVEEGGAVTFNTAPLAGTTVLLSREIALQRTTDYQYNGDLKESTVDNDFNRIWQALQGQGAILGGAVRAPFPEQIPALPRAFDRANKVLAFDSNGDPLASIPASGSAADVLLQLAGSGGSALVGFMAQGTGAVLRTVQDRLRETVSVKDYGALGDGGVTDDTAAFLNAVAAVVAGGPYGAIFIPPGIYKLTQTVVVPKGVSVFGAGGLASMLACHDCDGLVIQTSTWDQNMAFYRDFGMIVMSGTNRTGFRCATSPYAGEQDGFYLRNLRMFGFDTSVYFGSCWQSVVSECYLENTNTAVRLDGHAVLNIIEKNQIIRGAGGAGAAANLGVQLGFTDIEANFVRDNFIYGFQRCAQLNEPWFGQVSGNTMLAVATPGAAIECLVYGTAKEKLIIENNIFEGAPGVGTSFRALVASPLNSPSGGSVTIAKNRFFDDTSVGTGSIGLKINDTALTNNNNVHVYDNNFIGFTTADIRVDNPNNVVIYDNDCHSAGATNSIVVQGAITAPARVLNNSCLRPNSFDATALANGSLQVDGNSDNGVYTPTEVWNRTWTPANASADAVTLTVNSATYSYDRKEWSVRFDVTYPVTAGAALARISLPAIPAAAFTGLCGYTDFGQFVAYNTAAGSANFIFYNAAGTALTNAAMSGKRVSGTINFTVA